MAARFAAPVTDSEEARIREGAVPAKTKANTDWGMRVWSQWASERAVKVDGSRSPVSTPLLQMSPEDLAYWMGKFVLEVRKRDGTEYPPKTVYALVCCFKRYFEENGIHEINPLNTGDSRFGNFRVTLDAEMKRLHGIGLGTKSKQAEPITEDEECLLWSSGELGIHSAKSLLNTVYYYNCKVFGLRSYDEHRNLRRGQYSKKVDERGRVYLEYSDFGSKTNRGGLKHMKVENKVIRQYENVDDGEHCIVNIFLYYITVLPEGLDSFYHRPLPDDGSGIPRFGKQVIGRNKLAQIIPDMCKKVGIEGHKTGHSGKVTCATSLYKQNFSDQLIKERTGHRSLESLHKYKRTGSDQQFDVSMALLPAVSSKSAGKENLPPLKHLKTDDDDDFIVPSKKKPKTNQELDVKYVPPLSTLKKDGVKAMFPKSTLTNCTFNITFSK